MTEAAVEAHLADVVLVAERDRLLANDAFLIDIGAPIEKFVYSRRRGDEHR